MSERSWLSEIVLVVVLGAFALGCMAVLATAARFMPATGTASASAGKPTPTVSPANAVSTRLALAPRSPVPLPSPTAVPTATPTQAQIKASYVQVVGKNLAQQPDLYRGKKIYVIGKIFYTRPDGESTWVQVITPDRVFIDASFRGNPKAVVLNANVKLYGTGAGTTTIVANDGKSYKQPFINPADFLEAA